ncbi:MAG: hypothetical protein OHK0029_41970 [Armatimonadaceae bacterium]
MKDKLALLAQATRSIIAGVPLEEQMRSLAQQVCTFFNTDGCVIRALEGNQLLLIASHGIPDPLLYPTLSAQAGLAGRILGNQRALAIADTTTEPVTLLRFQPGGYHFRSYAGAPLLVGNTATGILGIYNSQEKREFDEIDLEFLQVWANHAAVALENHHLVQSLEREKAERDVLLRDALERAERDPLTGLLNYHAFYSRINEEARRARAESGSFAVALMDLDNFKFFNEGYGHAAGDRVLQQVAQQLRQFVYPELHAARLGGDEFALVLPGERPDGRSELQHRLDYYLLHIGYQPPGYAAQIPLRLSAGVAYFPSEAATVSQLMQQADERLFQNKVRASDAVGSRMRRELMGTYPRFALLDALISAVDAKDRYTRRHCEEVFFYAGLIAEELGVSESELETLLTAALLHDMGKIVVPDRILRIPTQLDRAEFDQMKQHVEVGALLAVAANMPTIAPPIRHHHEAWDGTGYPEGLQGEEIPLLARILGVADAFSAMISDRPYRQRLPVDVALDELLSESGQRWDRHVVEALLKVAGSGRGPTIR